MTDKKPTKRIDDTLTVRKELGTRKLADDLADAMTELKGVPVSRPIAIHQAIESMLQRVRKQLGK